MGLSQSKSGVQTSFPRDWFRTGDRVRINEDGKVQFLGRIDNQLKIKGIFVSPIEIESIIMDYEGIENCVTVGAKNSDGLNVIHTFILLSNNNEEFNKKNLQEFIRSKLPKEKAPSQIHIVDEMPKTINNKTRRKYFVDMLEKQ